MTKAKAIRQAKAESFMHRVELKWYVFTWVNGIFKMAHLSGNLRELGYKWARSRLRRWRVAHTIDLMGKRVTSANPAYKEFIYRGCKGSVESIVNRILADECKGGIDGTD